MPRGRPHSRTRSRSRSLKRGSRRRRSRTRSPSPSSPRYKKRSKSPSHYRRYSSGRRYPSPKGRRYSHNSRDRKYKRSMSSSPEGRRKKSGSPRKRRYSRNSSRSPSPSPPRNQPQSGGFDKPFIDSGGGGASDTQDLEMRLRELQAGKASKFAPFVSQDNNRQVEYPKEGKVDHASGQQSSFSQSEFNTFSQREKYRSPSRHEQRPQQSSNRTESTDNQSYPRNYSPEGYADQKESNRKVKRSPHRSRKRSITPSSRSRKRSPSPLPKSHRRTISPRPKGKYRSRSRSPRHALESSKKRGPDDVSDPTRSPPRSSRLGPGIDSNLIVIPRRKDEGTVPIFDRPEIPIYTIRDDPSLRAEGYFDKEDGHRGQNVRRSSDYHQEPNDRNKHRAPSPTVIFRSTGLDSLKFPNSVGFFDRLNNKDSQIVSTTLGEIHDRMRESMNAAEYSQRADHLGSSDLRIALDRKQLSPIRSSFPSDLLAQERIIYENEKMVDSYGSSSFARSLSEDRRPVKERLGDQKHGEDDDHQLPDFRKEVDMLNQTNPSTIPKGRGYFYHDDREGSSRAFSPVGVGSSYRGRSSYRGIRGNYRGSFRGRRPFRGRFSYPGRGSLNRVWDRWTHDKFEDDKKDSSKKLRKEKRSLEKRSSEKSSKKEKRSKKSDGSRKRSKEDTK